METKNNNLHLASGRHLLLALVVCLFFLPGWNNAVHAQTDIVEDLLNSAGIGGTRGYRLQRIGANNTVGSLNAGTTHYPASSIKILQHFFAMTKVESGDWSLLGTNLDVCGGQNNCGADPNSSANGCAPISRTLSNVLSGMMLNSNNPRSNAVQEQVGLDFYPSMPPFSTDPSSYGRGMMTQFAQNDLGATQTSLNHKFSCGGPCVPNINSNTWTLDDASQIYRQIATSNLLSMSNRVAMKDLMLNENQAFLQNIIDQEAADLGKAVHATAFKAKMYQIFKGGDWTCNGTSYISLNGLIQLPTYNGGYKRLYTWGIDLDATQAAFLNQATFQAAAEELLRPVIRGALLTWTLPYEGTITLGDIADDVEIYAKNFNMSSPEHGFMEDAVQSLRLASQLLANGSERFFLRASIAMEDANDKLELARTFIGRTAGLKNEMVALLEVAMEITEDMRAYLISTSDDPGLDNTLRLIAENQKDAQTAAKAKRMGLAHSNLSQGMHQGSFLIDWNLTETAFADASAGYVPTSGSKTSILAEQLPTRFQAGPNPFLNKVAFTFTPAHTGQVSLKVYDLRGQEVAELLNHEMKAGEEQQVSWEPAQLPEGIYLVRLTTPEGVEHLKIIKQQ